jgi:hypothetical protein
MSVARSLISKIAVLAGILLLAAGVGSVSAASCSGSSCAGKNPQTEGCSSDAVNKGNVHSDDYLTVAIRYSPACDAWWARVTCDGPDPTLAVYASIIQFTNGVQSSRQRLAGDHGAACNPSETTWTYMIADRSSGDHYNACWDYGNWGTELTPTESDYCVGRF